MLLHFKTSCREVIFPIEPLIHRNINLVTTKNKNQLGCRFRDLFWGVCEYKEIAVLFYTAK